MATFSSINTRAGKTIDTIADLDSLRSYSPRKVRDGDTVIVTGRQEIGDGDGGIYAWVDDSSAVDDGQTAIRPNMATGRGRWVKVAGRGEDGTSGLTELAKMDGSTLVGYGATTVAATLDATKKFNANMPLFAGNYGLVDDPNVGTANQLDQSVALQTFLDLCSAQFRVAHFGKLRIGISKTINVTTGMVFERMSFAASGEAPTVGLVEPGIYPSGNNYTALLVTGIITGFCVTVVGRGYATTDAAGNITSDTRPSIVGIQFGDNLDTTGNTMIVSQINFARVVNMSGCGIRIMSVFDSNFEKLHTETCGNATNAAIEITDGGAFHTTNESVFNYIQAEFSRQRALFISPRTLSCTFNKIHSERASGKAGVPLWTLGGASNTYISVRMQDLLGNGHCDTYAIDSTFIGMRAENVTVKVNASGGRTAFVSCIGKFASSPSQNGVASFYGCAGSWESINAGFRLYNCEGSVKVGFNPDPRAIVLEGCLLTTVGPDAGQTTAAFTLSKTRVGSLTPGSITYAVNNSFINAINTIGYNQFYLIDSTINASVTVDNAALNLVGNWRINGDLTINGARQSTATAGGIVTGSVSQWGPPTINNQFLTVAKGQQMINLAPSEQGTSPNKYLVTGWVFDGTNWLELRVSTGN